MLRSVFSSSLYYRHTSKTLRVQLQTTTIKQVLIFAGGGEVDERQAAEAGLAAGQEISTLLTLATRPQGQTPVQDGQMVVWEPAKTGCDQLKPTRRQLSPSRDPKTHYTLIIIISMLNKRHTPCCH